MDAGRLPAAVLLAARDRHGGATEVAATAVDGLLEVAGDPPLLEESVRLLLAGQPAMAPIWHLAKAARGPDPLAALADLRRRLHADTGAAVATAAAWLHRHSATHPGAVATVSHSSLVDRVLARAWPSPPDAAGDRPASSEPARDRPASPEPARDWPASSVRYSDPRWRSVADPDVESPRSSTAPDPDVESPRSSTTPDPDAESPRSSTAPVVAVVGADAIGPAALLNARGTAELAWRLPTLVVATDVKLVPAEVFARLGGPGFETVPLEAVTAVVLGPEVLSPAEAGGRAAGLG